MYAASVFIDDAASWRVILIFRDTFLVLRFAKGESTSCKIAATTMR